MWDLEGFSLSPCINITSKTGVGITPSILKQKDVSRLQNSKNGRYLGDVTDFYSVKRQLTAAKPTLTPPKA